MIFAAVCFAGVVFSVLGAVIWFRKKNIVEGAVLGVITWFFAHIFASMGLFLIDRYTVFRAGCGAAVLSAAALAAALFARRSKPFRWRHIWKHDFSVKDMLIPVIVCVLAVPFVMRKNEFFGMGQDQGVYQTQAIYFINGDTKRQKELSEYDEMETDEEREFFESTVKGSLGGYDIPAEDYPDTVYDRTRGPVSGIIHGIPTYSALLAMWGKVFGISNMQGFETILYICLIFLVYFICCNLRLKKTTAACACAATAFAPIVIWVAKSSLTEILLSLVPAVFLYLITDEEEPANRSLSIIPILVFGCYHVSFYTMLPVFVMIYGGMYFFTRESRYAVLMPVTVAFYAASYFMMRHIQPFYTMNNYKSVFVGGLNVNNITAAVAAASAVLLAAVIVFAVIVKRHTKKDFSAVRFARSAAASKGFLLLLRLMLILPCVYIIARALIKYRSWGDMNHVALLGFAGNAGLILMPLGIVFALVYVRSFAEKPSRLVIFLMFFYCVLVYSSFLRYEIQYYYYYGRYLAPFISVAVIFAAVALDRAGGKLLIPVTAAGLLYVARFDAYLMINVDDSRIEWSVMEDLADFIGEADCVVISSDYASKLWLAVRSMTGAKVIPEDKNDSGQLDRLAERYGRVSVLTAEVLDEDIFSNVYSNKIHHCEDDLNYTGRIVPFSKSFWKIDDDIRLYSYDRSRYVYTAKGDYTSLSGVSNLEPTLLCWTDSEDAQIKCGFPAKDYDVTLELGDKLPLDKIGIDKAEVTLLLNGREIGTQAITPENNGEPLHFSLKKELVNDGENILYISSPLWKAALSNPADGRTLGIPFRAVRFEAVQ